MGSPTERDRKRYAVAGTTAAACDFGIRSRSDSLAPGTMTVIRHSHGSPAGGDAVRQPSVPG